jgi:hypothetical protein
MRYLELSLLKVYRATVKENYLGYKIYFCANFRRAVFVQQEVNNIVLNFR